MSRPLTQAEAYPDGRFYEQRQLTQYNVGDKVTVGPAYRMGGTYELDGAEGPYYVVGSIMGRGHSDYKLAAYSPADPWEIIVHSSRLSPA